jgi:hypothetical protein
MPFEKFGGEWVVKIDSFRINSFCHTDKTCYGTEWPGVRIPVGSRYFLFSISVQTGPPTLLYNGKKWSSPGVKRPERGIFHQPHLAPMLSILIYTHTHSAFMAFYGATFTFTVLRLCKMRLKLNLHEGAVCLCLVSHPRAFCEIWFW